MANYTVTDTELTDIADAIIAKAGLSGQLEFPDDFVDGIEGISTGTDVSDTTATASDVRTGKYFYTANGTKTQGTIASKTSSDVTTSNNVVTIPAGHYASQVQKTVGTAQAAQTITPGTTNQTIASGKYLTGVQTILGDANLVAGNIKKGVTIFGVTGTYEGEAPTFSFTVSSVTYVAEENMTWSQWVASTYNTDGKISIVSNEVRYNYPLYHVIYNREAISGNTAIIPNYSYTVGTPR